MRTLLLTGSALLFAATLQAQDSVHMEGAFFPPGKPVTLYMGSVRSNTTAIYVVTARAGQTMNVSMLTSQSANYFSVYAPGADTALFNGPSNSESGFSGPLPVSGDYKIKVFVVLNQPRPEEAATYSLAIRVTE